MYNRKFEEKKSATRKFFQNGATQSTMGNSPKKQNESVNSNEEEEPVFERVHVPKQSTNEVIETPLTKLVRSEPTEITASDADLPSPFQTLPKEVVLKILSHLPSRQLRTAELCCRFWRQLSEVILGYHFLIKRNTGRIFVFKQSGILNHGLHHLQTRGKSNTITSLHPPLLILGLYQ